MHTCKQTQRRSKHTLGNEMLYNQAPTPSNYPSNLHEPFRTVSYPVPVLLVLKRPSKPDRRPRTSIRYYRDTTYEVGGGERIEILAAEQNAEGSDKLR